MTLTLHKHIVNQVKLGEQTGINQGCLSLDAAALARTLQEQDHRLARIRVRLALPGEATRILCVKDVVQPRAKAVGTEPGTGVLCVLENVAIATCGPIVGFQEGIIDMSGPGAAYTPFSRLPLIVLEIDVHEPLDPHAHEEALREAGTRAAKFVAQSCLDSVPDQTEEVLWDEVPCAPSLPRIGYVYIVLSQGLLHDTYVLGRNAQEGLPISVDPRIVLDNGVLSGNCVSACDKNTTFHHQNNPVIAELLSGHGTRWNFTGVVITNEPTRLAEKQLSAAAAVEKIIQMKSSGVIISKEGFGNPDADLMMIVRDLEQAGIKTVAITDEFAGSDGASQSLADTTPEADALVSTGNANERVELPAMATTIGPLPDVSRLAGGYPHSLRDDGSMEVELQAIIGATNQLGYSHLSCREA
ncbi:MAG: beta-aspartyl-peptidase [Alphaproteobacteria bacterium]|nr:beta-aspartyl-peptidase [Alphaproteobacteria bacterium]